MIKASEIGTEIYKILVETVETEFTGETEAVKQEAIATILGAWSIELFK